VTRDRHFAPAEWNGRRFWLVDTGGMVPGATDPLNAHPWPGGAGNRRERRVVFLVDIDAGSIQWTSRSPSISGTPSVPCSSL